MTSDRLAMVCWSKRYQIGWLLWKICLFTRPNFMVEPPRFVGPVGRVQARLPRAWSQPRASVLSGTRGLCLSIHSWSPTAARRQEKIDQWTLSLQIWPSRLSSLGVVEKRFLSRGPDEMSDSFTAPWSLSFWDFFQRISWGNFPQLFFHGLSDDRSFLPRFRVEIPHHAERSPNHPFSVIVRPFLPWRCHRATASRSHSYANLNTPYKACRL